MTCYVCANPTCVDDCLPKGNNKMSLWKCGTCKEEIPAFDVAHACPAKSQHYVYPDNMSNEQFEKFNQQLHHMSLSIWFHLDTGSHNFPVCNELTLLQRYRENPSQYTLKQNPSITSPSITITNKKNNQSCLIHYHERSTQAELATFKILEKEIIRLNSLDEEQNRNRMFGKFFND